MEENAVLSQEQALDEARKQKDALAKIGGWRRRLFLLTASLLVLAVFGLRNSGVLFVVGVAAAIAAAVSFLLMCVVDLSIRNGHRNVKRILASLQYSQRS